MTLILRRPKFLLLFAAVFPTISYAQRESDYYSQECTVQAGNAKYFATLRDRGASFSQAVDVIKEKGRYPTEHHAALLTALENTYSLTSSSPDQIFSSALSSCQNRGRYQGRKPMVGTGRAAGKLSNDQLASCEKLFKQLDSDRDTLTNYEVQLDQKSKQMEVEGSSIERSKKTQESDQNLEQLNARVRGYNSAVNAFLGLRQSYDVLASEFNKKTNQYNRDCGGKGIR